MSVHASQSATCLNTCHHAALTSLNCTSDLRSTEGDGAHRILIEYVGVKYKDFTTNEIRIIDDMREKRNKAYYEGILLPEDYLEKRRDDINSVVIKLKQILKNKIESASTRK